MIFRSGAFFVICVLRKMMNNIPKTVTKLRKHLFFVRDTDLHLFGYKGKSYIHSYPTCYKSAIFLNVLPMIVFEITQRLNIGPCYIMPCDIHVCIVVMEHNLDDFWHNGLNSTTSSDDISAKY